MSGSAPNPGAPTESLPRVDLRREFRSPASRADPGPVYSRLRALGPVLRSKDLLGSGFALPRHEDVVRSLKDPRFASDRSSVTGRSLDQWWTPSLLKLLVASMVLKDPPEHRRLRTLVQKAFTPARVENLRAIAFYERAGWAVTDRTLRTVEHGISYDERVLTKHRP